MEDGAWSRDDVAAQLEKLDELEKGVEHDLADERTLNDPGATRVRDLEAKARAIATGREWIARRMGSAPADRRPGTSAPRR
jgi:hypothetical protein